MSGLLIVGAGGHGKVVADMAQSLGRWDEIAFLDDIYSGPSQVGDWKLLGKIEDANRFLEAFPEAIIAIGSNQLRLALQQRMTRDGFRFPVLIHPDASVSRHASIGAGTVICAQSAVIIDAQIGIGAIVNTGASVGHDCRVEDGVHVAPGVRLAGGASIGECSWIGIGAVVKECIAIGRGVLVGAGSTILNNVPDGVTVVGSPGRIIHGCKQEQSLTPRNEDHALIPSEPRFIGFIPPSDPRWSESISKAAHDFFHLPGYVEATARHEGGEPLLFLLDHGSHGMLVPLVRRSLNEFGPAFSGFTDLSSPYGYPSPLYWGEDWQSRIPDMHRQFEDFLREQKVVSLFLRLNPFTGAPDALLGGLGGLITHGPMVYIDLRDEEQSWNGITQTNRRFISRALDAGQDVRIDQWDTMDDVITSYYETMQRLNAAPAYFFPREYFQQLRETTNGHLHLATAFTADGEIMAGCFFTEVDGLIQYYLMGTFEAFMTASPSKLIINALRIWGLKHGHHTINLGGGVGSRRDGLFNFKVQLSKSLVEFSTFRKVILPEVFKALAELQGWTDLEDEFFPVYRKPRSTQS